MKCTKLLLGLGLVVALTSCDTGESEITQKFNSPALNIISSVADGSVVVSDGGYLFDLIVTSQTGTVTGTLIMNNQNVTFSTPQMHYSAPTMIDAIFNNIDVMSTGGLSVPVSGMVMATSNYFLPGSWGVSSDFNPSYGQSIPIISIAKYKLGNEYMVRTFQKNTFFGGETKTTFPYMGDVQNYTTDKIGYGVILTKDKETNEYTADLHLYNAKFTDVPQEPIKKEIIVKGLPVVFGNGKITFEGTDIVPDVVEGTSSTPNEDYIFNSVSFTTTNDELTTATIKYEVASKYYGSFSGKYAVTQANSNLPNN